MKLDDLTGMRFGRLVVIERSIDGKRRHPKWLCQCDCGNKRIVFREALRDGRTQSCGCLQKETAGDHCRTHGATIGGRKARHPTPEYRSWCKAKERCYNPNTIGFRNWGGRGIEMCQEWRNDFSAFLSHMGKRPDGCSLDRINPNGNYEPGNCRWTTPKGQGQTRRDNVLVNDGDERVSLIEFARRRNLDYKRLHRLVRREGLSLNQAMRELASRPIRSGPKRTKCFRGHELTPENIRKKGNTRHCRQCDLIRNGWNRAKYQARHAALA